MLHVSPDSCAPSGLKVRGDCRNGCELLKHSWNFKQDIQVLARDDLANIHVWAGKLRVENESMFFHRQEEDLLNVTQIYDTVSQCIEQNWI